MSSRRRTVHRIASALITTLMVVALGAAALMVLPSLLGFERYVIVSGSMEPTIPVGAVVYDEVVPVDDLEVGDIITFVPPQEFGIDAPVTHRIVDITSTAPGNGQESGAPVFRTKGDANKDPDPWRMILNGSDQARVKHQIPYVGYVYIALQQRWVQLLVIGLPSLGLIVYIVAALWRASGEGVRAERAPETAGDGEGDGSEVEAT